MPHAFATLSALLVMAAFAIPVSATSPGFGPPAIEPIVLLDGGQIAGCGAEAKFAGDAGHLAIGVMIVRAAGGHGERVVRANWKTSDGSLKTIRRIAVTSTTHEAPSAGHRWSTGADGVSEARSPAATPADWSAFGALMQDLLVGGGRAEIETADGAVLRLPLPGPAPNMVRATYLNCAGDMFRHDR